ncbi:MAG: hypothetical protein FWF63_11605 [Fibromonadales bacterium]|nr:hypothetical protein [Fibromonadales bacterium]
MRQIFLILALFCVSFAYNVASSPVLGPNIEYGVFGSAAPAGFRGAFVPQLNTNFDFNWLEFLGEDGYGVWKPNKTNYLRFMAGAELSPFYGTLRMGLGFAPLPPPFAILELRFVYSNENMFWSDVEMPMKPGDKPPVQETWNAKYMFDQFYGNSKYSQIQSYDVQLGGRYTSQTFELFFLFHFALIDIASDYEKKSFDYMRGIPLYSRDYVVAEEFSGVYNIGSNFSWGLDFSVMFSGRQFKFYSPFKAYDKEPLSYSVVSTGPLWRFSDGRSYISFSPGFFTRGGKENVFSDSFEERILLSIQYKYFWDFRFGKE